LGKKGLIFGDSWFKGCPNVISWRDGLKYDDLFLEKIKTSEDILNFLLNEKSLNTVPGCINISFEKAHSNFINDEKFRQAEHDGVIGLMETLFHNLPK
jgi:hypothetical protein